MIIYKIDKRTKTIYSLPSEREDKFDVGDCQQLGIEPTEEEKKADELLITIEDDDSPF